MSSNVIVVDANVWLDYLFGARPKSADSKRFLAVARRNDIPLVIPAHSLKDVFYLTQKALKDANRRDGKMPPTEAAASARAAAWSAVDFIMELASVGPSDHSDAVIASRNRAIHSDFEDNLVVACAMRTDARMLVTNDEKLIRHSLVATLCAADAYECLRLQS